MLDPFDHLIRVLNRLPSIGRRSAERLALRLATDAGPLRRELMDALQEVDRGLALCSRCGGLTDAGDDPCRLCRSPRRTAEILCVVETPGDILLLERAGAFDGRYHCLGGKLSPMRGQGAPDLRLDSLRSRIQEEGVRELLLALNTDVESDATGQLVREAVQSTGVRITHLAWGLPAGSGLVYADAQTLTRAIQGRQAMDG